MIASVIHGFLPVFVVIACGYTLRTSGIAPDFVWAGVNRLNYRVLLPALLFSTLAGVDLLSPSAGRLVLLALAGIALVAFTAFAWSALLGLSRRNRAAMLATTTVWNFVLVLSLSQNLFGAEAVEIAIIILVPGAILGTLISRVAVAANANFEALSGAARDPIVVACLMGLAASLTPLSDYTLIMRPLEIIASASIGLVLLTIGAGLDFAALRGRYVPLVSAALIRAVVSPIIFLGLGLVARLGTLELEVLVLAAAAPTAAFIYALVAESEGEHGLTAGMITASVLVSALSAPAFILIARSLA
jgi:hypothetical protein